MTSSILKMLREQSFALSIVTNVLYFPPHPRVILRVTQTWFILHQVCHVISIENGYFKKTLVKVFFTCGAVCLFVTHHQMGRIGQEACFNLPDKETLGPISANLLPAIRPLL